MLQKKSTYTTRTQLIDGKQNGFGGSAVIVLSLKHKNFKNMIHTFV